MTTPQWQFWIDRGGTFTDIVARTPAGELICQKLLSHDPARYADAAVHAIRVCLEVPAGTPVPTDRIAAVKMGTTVATNALLERTGDRTVLIITAGFADALRIGYQNRPELFARRIVLPELLYEEVVEAGERVDAGGTVLRPLDEAALAQALSRVRAAGVSAAAIVFMHAWRYPDHERRAAAIARECGFGQVSTSHEVGPLIKLVGRGDTTVADAYLSPLLGRYVAQVGAQLGIDPDDSRLMFMQSNGGLTAARGFRGKDAVLSGPAGGVVGMAQTAARAGFGRVIGFDMGGTSTDVSLYRGEYERSLENEVAGVRLRAPMMQIHTVAAGGGSILRYADGRLQVGPASAGADPGPACYRRGGPLTVTDANVMLGRIRSEFFPAVFGDDGRQPLDDAVVRERFAALAERIGAGSDAPADTIAVADGFLTVAVEIMANAIRKISTRKGHDLADFALNCFGGAGGQHACRVADALGMQQIVIHPLAGVLSAYGMGLADIRVMRQQTVEQTLSAATLAGLAPAIEKLSCSVAGALLDQRVGVARHCIVARLLLRYAGTDTPLPVTLAGAAAMQGAFEQAHRALFGFVTPQRDLVIDALEIEGIGRATPAPAGRAAQPDGGTPRAVATHPVVMADGRHATPFFERAALTPGQQVDGPAVIVEDTGTTVVEPGWRAAVDPDRCLALGRIRPRPRRRSVGTDADPVMLEVFNNLFMHIAEQMGVVLARTAQSVNIKERLDFSCAVFDATGRLVANAPHMPVHLGSMGESVRAVIDGNRGTQRPGDVYVVNAPYNGGTHLPDITVVAPVYGGAGGGELLFHVASRGHHADVGGITPGSMPPASRSIDEEGILLDNFLLVRDGEFREDALRAVLTGGRWPARNPDQNVADLKAQVAANERGAAELRAMIERYGLATVRAYMGHVQDNAAESVRRVIDVLRDGDFRYELDNGLAIRVAVSIDRETRTATVDFSGTSAQSEGNFNAPRPVCRAAVLYVFRTLVDDPIPMNEGCLRPVRLIVPAGSLLDPVYPAAVVAGNVETSQCIVDALYGALGVMAAAQGTMNNLTFGNAEHQYYETICGGTGAGDGYPGASAVHSHMTNSRLTDPEILEWRYPVLVQRFARRTGSGGAGRWRGGDGAIREIAFREPMSVSILSNHRRVAPFGLAGGQPGATGSNLLRRADGDEETLPATATVEVGGGDAIVIATPGGGGYGAPGGDQESGP